MPRTGRVEDQSHAAKQRTKGRGSNCSNGKYESRLRWSKPVLKPFETTTIHPVVSKIISIDRTKGRFKFTDLVQVEGEEVNDQCQGTL